MPLSAVVLWALERAFFGESKQIKSLLLGGFADQSFGERANFRVFVFVVSRLVLDRVVENDFQREIFSLEE